MIIAPTTHERLTVSYARGCLGLLIVKWTTTNSIIAVSTQWKGRVLQYAGMRVDPGTLGRIRIGITGASIRQGNASDIR